MVLDSIAALCARLADASKVALASAKHLGCMRRRRSRDSMEQLVYLVAEDSGVDSTAESLRRPALLVCIRKPIGRRVLCIQLCLLDGF